MPSFSERSNSNLLTLEYQLQEVLNETIRHYDFTIICGFRNESDQELAYANGASKVHFPNSKHNTFPSKAVDIAPYPIDWGDEFRFYELASILLEVASNLQVRVKWGGNWKVRRVSSLRDLPHFELS